jgi:hypothetical protein
MQVEWGIIARSAYTYSYATLGECLAWIIGAASGDLEEHRRLRQYLRYSE